MSSLLEWLIFIVFILAAITFIVIINTVLMIKKKSKKMYYDYGVMIGRKLEREEIYFGKGNKNEKREKKDDTQKSNGKSS